MAKDIFTQNERFLKEKGLELKPTGAMFTPYALETEDYYLSLGEWQDLSIHNKKTGERNSVNLVTQILCDEDFETGPNPSPAHPRIAVADGQQLVNS